MGEFGFSFVGTAFLLAALVPNLLWARFGVASDYDPSGENRVLRVIERTGQVLLTASLVLFSDTGLRAWTPWSWWLVAAIAAMLLYEAAWIRYFAGPRRNADFYRPLLGIPVPLALLPMLGCLLLGVYGLLLPLIVSAIVAGIGHVGIHLQHALRAR
ncbi:hypothetical protein J4H92_01550 [Leucobacter weissii]|uniref:Uncharacterized protein n=1 Tax=Leucobacter weissii TaxID=1983706 RepID=A0A939MHC2_9MICO|nr:hypothetical protein [Leucobacter weissii]MBO1900631.1 hypothetical protein [Leucobacter weissii]